MAAWLADLLAPGPSPVAEVYETAEAERGFRSTWVARAAQAIGVVAVDLDGERAWALPELARLPERVGVRSAEQEPPRDDREAPTWEDEWAEPF